MLEFASSRARLALFHGPLDFIQRIVPPGYLEKYREIVNPADEEPRGLSGMQRWVKFGLDEMRRVLAPVFAVNEMVSFSDLPRAGVQPLASDPSALLRYAVQRLEQAGMETLCVDLSPPGKTVHAVKMIVPGLEVETMSYRRIGERNIRRLLNRQATGDRFPTLVGIGAPAGGARPIPLTDTARRRLGGDAWLNDSKMTALMENLYVLYREPSRHVTTFSCQ